MDEHATERTSLDHDRKTSLVVRFNPPAFLQRRAFVLTTLKSLNPKCRTLLDVGTGEGGLLGFLVRCDDDVPIRTMVGIDPDTKALDLAAIATAPCQRDHEDLRWNPLGIDLYQGGISDLQAAVNTFDCVTAIEVLEHLDPPDVDALSKKCLGELKPRCFIVTTPNRDFNMVFARLNADDKHVYVNMYARVDYTMRHSDHRFELTRAEFQSWAWQQCQIYGYAVSFHGIGSVANAFSGQTNWREIFCEEDLNHTYGCSTQVAVFSRITSPSGMLNVDDDENRLLRNELLRHVATHKFPWTDKDGYPPSHEQIECIITGAEAYFRPMFDSTMVYTSKGPVEVAIECKTLFDTCYALQRISRFDLEIFLSRARSMLYEKLERNQTNVLSGADTMLINDYESEPRATFVEAHFAIQKDKTLALIYTFDTSSFSKVKNPVFPYDTAHNTASTTCCDGFLPIEWDISPMDEPLREVEESLNRLVIDGRDGL